MVHLVCGALDPIELRNAEEHAHLPLSNVSLLYGPGPLHLLTHCQPRFPPPREANRLMIGKLLSLKFDSILTIRSQHHVPRIIDL
jgi:hypothetical protein